MDHDHGNSDDVTITDNNAFLMAMGKGSRIEIHAADAQKEAWSQLDVTARSGDQTITVDEVTGWEAGDRIAIASSGYDHTRAEEFTITEIQTIDGKSVITLDKAVQNYHHGSIETYDNGLTGSEYQEWQLDQRAEVALLSRNITIRGDADSATDQYGGHMMVMNEADMHVSGAAFENMGQANEMGRYPIHTHMLGDSAEGLYVTDVSVVNSFNKGIAIHDTNNMWFEDNVVYNTTGHGFFFEDGSETGNVLKGNLAFNQNAATPDQATIPTDATHASSYWVTNPNNHFLDNHAAGADHSGFFFSYEDAVNGLAGASGDHDGYVPGAEAFGLFNGNTAHSNKHNLWHGGDTAEDGTFIKNSFSREINEDGTLYAPHIEDFTSYRAWERAIFNKDVGGVYDDIKSAGNNADFFINAGTVVQNSLSVGQSDNPGDIQWEAEREAGTELPPGTGFNGYSWYDGGQLIRDSHFAGFTGEHDTAFSLKFGQMMGGGNVLDGITFAEDTTGANQYSHGSYWDGADGTAADEIALQVVDLDGSLTGISGASLTSALAHLGEETFGFQAAPGAIYNEDWNVWINAPEHDIGHLKLRDSAEAPFEIERSDGLKVTLNDNTNSSEVLVVANTDLSYVIRDSQTLDRDIVHMRVGDLQEGSGFYLAFEDVAETAVLNGATEVADKTAADAYEGTAYYRDGDTIHVKVYADSRPVDQIHDAQAAVPETVYWEDRFEIDVTGQGGLTPRDNFVYDWGTEKQKVAPAIADVDPDPVQPASTSKTVDLDGSEQRWSDMNTWSGDVPGPDDIVVIEAGERVLLDQDAMVKGIVIKGGDLVVEDVQDLALASDWILVIEGGLFQVGTETNPHVHDFTLTLEGDDPDADLSLSAIMADPDTLYVMSRDAEPGDTPETGAEGGQGSHTPDMPGTHDPDMTEPALVTDDPAAAPDSGPLLPDTGIPNPAPDDTLEEEAEAPAEPQPAPEEELPEVLAPTEGPAAAPDSGPLLPDTGIPNPAPDDTLEEETEAPAEPQPAPEEELPEVLAPTEGPAAAPEVGPLEDVVMDDPLAIPDPAPADVEQDDPAIEPETASDPVEAEASPEAADGENFFEAILSFFRSILDLFFGDGDKNDAPTVTVAADEGVLLSDLLPVTGSMDSSDMPDADDDDEHASLEEML